MLYVIYTSASAPVESAAWWIRTFPGTVPVKMHGKAQQAPLGTPLPYLIPIPPWPDLTQWCTRIMCNTALEYTAYSLRIYIAALSSVLVCLVGGTSTPKTPRTPGQDPSSYSYEYGFLIVSAKIQHRSSRGSRSSYKKKKHARDRSDHAACKAEHRPLYWWNSQLEHFLCLSYPLTKLKHAHGPNCAPQLYVININHQSLRRHISADSIADRESENIPRIG